MADYLYRIGATAGTMLNLEDVISVPPAGCRFNYHPIARISGDGMSVGDGYSTCVWVFQFLSWADLYTMLDYLAGEETVALYIDTRRPDNTYATYSAVMHRPRVPNEATQVMGGWRNVTFTFTHLEAA